MDGLVECHSGYTYAERPIAVYWNDDRHAVDEIIKSWRTPEGPAYQVRITNGEVLTLVYQEHLDRWTITAGSIPGSDYGF